MAGGEKPVTVAGKGEVIREYSDRMLEILLKAHRPEKYREPYDVSTRVAGSDLDREIRELGCRVLNEDRSGNARGHLDHTTWPEVNASPANPRDAFERPQLPVACSDPRFGYCRGATCGSPPVRDE